MMVKYKWSNKISNRLTMIYSLLFFVVLALVNAAILISIHYYINHTSEQQLGLVDQAIINEVKSLDDIPNIEIKNISKMIENVDINLIYNNRVIYNSGEHYSLPFNSSKKGIIAESEENKIMYLNDVHSLKNGNKIGIQVIKDMNDEQEYLHALSGIMLLIDAVSLVISIMVGYIVSKNALSPIDKIINQAKKISVSNLTARIEIDGPEDELKRLANTFNDFISRIQYSYEKQNRFVLDASHELATPLAVIKGYIDVLDRWGKEERAVLDEGIESIKIELSNMTELLDTLLFLAKSDNEMFKIEETNFALRDLIAEIVKETKIIDGKKHSILSTETEAPVTLLGDRRLIKQMIRAIVDNSVKYSPENGVISIDYSEKAGAVIIIVSDNGIGIPEEDLANIFDRFYRVDKARTRTIGGLGLGLSIVKWIVDMHQGKIKVESEIGKGTKMTVELPINAKD